MRWDSKSLEFCDCDIVELIVMQKGSQYLINSARTDAYAQCVLKTHVQYPTEIPNKYQNEECHIFIHQSVCAIPKQIEIALW